MVAALVRADGLEVLGVGEENGPAVADPLVEVHLPLRGVGREVGRLAIDPQRHLAPPCLKASTIYPGAFDVVRRAAAGRSEPEPPRVVPGRRVLAEIEGEKLVELPVPPAEGERHLEEALHGYGQELDGIVGAVVVEHGPAPAEAIHLLLRDPEARAA